MCIFLPWYTDVSQKWDEYTNSVGDEFIYLGTSVNLEVSDRYLQVSNYELYFIFYFTSPRWTIIQVHDLVPWISVESEAILITQSVHGFETMKLRQNDV